MPSDVRKVSDLPGEPPLALGLRPLQELGAQPRDYSGGYGRSESFRTSGGTAVRTMKLVVRSKVESVAILSYSFELRRGRIIGSAAVLKTAGRKAMQVRVLSPPPLFSTTYTIPRSPSFGPSSELARFWRASGVPGHQTEWQGSTR
jgi:hypothetical protein